MPETATGDPRALQIHNATVKPEWIDYNHHMNDGYYVVAFTRATDAVQDYVGLDAGYRQRSGCSIYTVEAHLQYLREVSVDAHLSFTSYILGVDEKRIHLLHAMYNADQHYLAASHELMLLHVDQKLGKTSPMPADVQRQLAQLHERHRQLATPVTVGRSIRPVTAQR